MSGGPPSLPLASYKLRFFDEHVRAVPLRGLDGCAFAGPGVDLRGEAARRAFDRIGLVRAWLEAREPGVVLRTMSVDLARPRVLITLEPAEREARPRVLRFDPPYAEELVAAAREVEREIGVGAARALAARSRADDGSSPRS